MIADRARRSVGRSVGRSVAPRRVASRRVARRRAMRWIAVAASGTPELGNVSMSTFAKRKRASAKAPARGDAKTIHLVRHGRTEMNDYLRENHWADPDFVDPMMIDTRLTSEGEAQARALRTIATALEPAPELIVASPLRRALRTAELAFGAAGEDALGDVPRVVCALARERVFHGSDIGRVARELGEDHPDWDLTELGDDDATWWYTPDGKDPFTTAELEPVDVFEERMQEFRRWLDARPEKSIAVIAHWGVCYSLTGDEFQNCELRTLDFHTDLDVGNGDFQKFDVFLQDNIWGQIGRALVSFKNKLF